MGTVSVELFRTLAASERKGRVFVVGDVHGEHEVLMKALDEVGFDFETDIAAFVGDLHDRGPSSAMCLNLVRQPWAISTLGNHEQLMVQATAGSGKIEGDFIGPAALWAINGGGWGLNATDAERAIWRKLILEEMPLYWVLERRDRQRILVCHAEPDDNYFEDLLAGVCRRVKLGAGGEEWTLWARRTIGLVKSGIQFEPGNLPVQKVLEEFLFLVHGHTPIKQVYWFHNQLFIDTGAVYGNRLTLVDIDRVSPGCLDGIYSWDVSSGVLLDNSV